MASLIPIGVNLTSIGVPSSWWIQTARSLESAGFSTAWCWDHFVSRGRLSDPVLECWTTLAATAASTEWLRVGSFVTNVMNRHPALLARMAATVQDQSGGRVELGIGIGGHPAEHHAYGIDFPDVPERVARLEEAVGILRLLWSGGPVDFEGRYYRLQGAHAFPVPRPTPRILIGGRSAGGARLAARIGDGWIVDGERLQRLAPLFAETLEASGRRRSEVAVLASLDLARDSSPSEQPILRDLGAEAQRWRERGADEIVLHWIRPRDIPALLAAGERADLSAAR